MFFAVRVCGGAALTLLAWFFAPGVARAQLGGRSAFSSLVLPTHARLAGLGGINLTSGGADPNVLTSNPALLDSTAHRMLSLSFVPFYADVQATALAYAHPLVVRGRRAGTLGAALQYIRYGQMPLTDPAGNVLGTFVANDYALTLAYARTRGNVTLGGSAKIVGSVIESYQGYAALLEVGGLFRHPTRDWRIGLTIKNFGLRLARFSPNDRADLPLDVQLGTSFKPQHLPVRVSITAHHLHRPGAAYDDPTQRTGVDANGNPVTERVSVADKVARHLVVGAEVLLSRHVHLRAGYHHQLNRELRLAGGAFGAGFSFGALVRVRAFELAFSRAYYHAVGGRNAFTLTCDTSRLRRAKRAD